MWLIVIVYQLFQHSVQLEAVYVVHNHDEIIMQQVDKKQPVQLGIAARALWRYWVILLQVMSCKS